MRNSGALKDDSFWYGLWELIFRFMILIIDRNMKDEALNEHKGRDNALREQISSLGIFLVEIYMGTSHNIYRFINIRIEESWRKNLLCIAHVFISENILNLMSC